jgi:hypothetical protein
MIEIITTSATAHFWSGCNHPQFIRKYNIARSRYTSYPTVPYWILRIFQMICGNNLLYEVF